MRASPGECIARLHRTTPTRSTTSDTTPTLLRYPRPSTTTSQTLRSSAVARELLTARTSAQPARPANRIIRLTVMAAPSQFGISGRRRGVVALISRRPEVDLTLSSPSIPEPLLIHFHL